MDYTFIDNIKKEIKIWIVERTIRIWFREITKPRLWNIL